MLRPERMSRVSVTGSKRVIDEVIDTVHDLRLLHVTEYDGAWEGFDPGSPIEGADEASDKLVTVRALRSILGVTDEDAGPRRIVTEEAIEEDLESIRQRVNDLDDRRNDLEDEQQEVEEGIDTLEPFVELGIDLDLLSGYDTLAVRVGEGDADAVRAALADADDVEVSRVFAEGDVVAAVAYPAEADLEDALVGVDFTTVEVPHVDTETYDIDPEGGVEPTTYLDALRGREQRLESKLATVESELEDLRLEVGGFLLAAEETLAIETEKREAPLTFATTENAFVAEGWIPTERFVDLAEGLADAIGDHVDVEELERADYDTHGTSHDTEDVDPDRPVGEPTPAAADGSGGAAASAGAGTGADAEEGEPEARPDGGRASDRPMSGGDPPVVQDNPSLVRPYELLTDAVGRPKYTELDPTIVLFLTFPLMFGFMIGDVGYGAIYTAIGYYVYATYDSTAFRRFGIVFLSAGALTVVFGFLYGEIFGLHLITQLFWKPLMGHPPIEKGLSPETAHWAEAWFVVTALFGVVHLTVGYVFEFVENATLHGLLDAVLETGSWLLALNGLWLFIFSRLYRGSKPDLLFTVFDHGEKAAFELGFAGLPTWTGWVGIAMVFAGIVLLLAGPTHEIIEIHVVLAHTLSYLRIGAVLLAKAGMAFAVNLLFFGAYQKKGEFHFMIDHGPKYVLEHNQEATIMFGGLIHGSVIGLVGGIVVLLVGHLVVLLLGITSAGIQGIRLEYFEFFSKFYEGGGTPYSPFGHRRQFTTEE